ncbi:hypothetical protein [Oceanobacillus neutriphilus]|uniref:Uncharacterized protein n=1 Tax=Oceanobacillus neutriphilus TaxID=531815 RepID=A0ABQ2P2T6_9BACI|nr:hypothetical protein [Oceanobacillus neutriphilus]GGP16927.1 hypothetical protein GCM10011346_50840 [Oceanobacillus neutriphilus]
MRAFLYYGLISFVIMLTACSSSESEETGNGNGNPSENEENAQHEDEGLEDDISSDNEGNQQEQSAEAKGESEENVEIDEGVEPGIYDPDEVSGRENPDADGNTVYPEALENLELPYIYENTVVYSGKINPDQDIRFELPLPDTDEMETVDPEVSEEGNFTIPLGGTKFEADDELIVYVMGSMPHEQQFVLPIQPAEEGMELVERSSETEAIKEIKEATYLPEFYENTSTYYGKTLPEVDVQVSEVDAFTADTMDLEADENGDFSGDFSNFPYVAAGEAGLQEGQSLLFTITDEEGHDALLLTEIQPPSDDPEYDGPVSEDD